MKFLITSFVAILCIVLIASYGQSTPQPSIATDAESAKERDDALRERRESQRNKLHQEENLSENDQRLVSQNANYATEVSVQSRGKALELARQGNSTAQFNLGYMYETGIGSVSQSKNLAIYWYKKAEAQGNISARARLISLSGEENKKSSLRSDKKSFFGSVLKGIGATAEVVFAVADAVNKQQAREQQYMEEQRSRSQNSNVNTDVLDINRVSYLRNRESIIGGAICSYSDGTRTRISGSSYCPRRN